MLATLRQQAMNRPEFLNFGFIATLAVTVFFGFTSIAHQNHAIVVQSYVLGDVAVASGTILSFVMGGYLFAGIYIAWKNKKLDSHVDLVNAFIKAELILLCISAFSAFIVFYIVNYLPWIGIPGVYGFYAFTNFLVGFEDLLLLALIGVTIPKVRDAGTTFQSLSAIGGMVAGVVLGMILIPAFGITMTPVVLGYIDGFSVLLVLIVFRNDLSNKSFRISGAIWTLIMACIVAATIYQEQFDLLVKRPYYQGNIVLAEGDLFGDMVLTCADKDHEVCRFYMDGHIQWGSHPGDEELYHDLLTHVPLSIVLERNACDPNCVRPLNILVLGGGDGMVVRELVKYTPQQIESVKLVDLNKTLTMQLARKEPLVHFNGNSFAEDRVTVYNDDAFTFVKEDSGVYDLIIVDLIDPRSDSVAKLYSKEFYAMAQDHLATGGVFITQGSSPQHSGRAYWRINYTLESIFASVIPYHANIVSFGDWGFIMASDQVIEPSHVHVDDDMTEVITTDSFHVALHFPLSMLYKEHNTSFPEDTKESVFAENRPSTITDPIVRRDYVNNSRWKLWE